MQAQMESKPFLMTRARALETGSLGEFLLSVIQEIRALVPGSVLLGFTGSAEWAISGGTDGAPVMPTNFGARRCATAISRGSV